MFTKDINQSIALKIIFILLLSGLCWINFENSLNNGFTFDDHLAIEGNGDVDIQNQPYNNLWLNDIWGKDLLAYDSHKSYRPLLISLFRWLWTTSKTNPSSFRLYSIVFHIIASILVFLLSKNLVSSYSVIPYGASILFASHPIHVEAVTAIVNMAEPLHAICVIVSYLLYKYHYNQQASNYFSIFSVFLWWVCTVSAVLFKETGVIGALLPLGHLLVLYSIDIYTYIFAKRRLYTIKHRLFSLIWLANLVVFILLYFAFRSAITHSDRLSILTSPQSFLQFFIQEYLLKLGKQQQESYLNTSELLRKAENPFAFLSGPTKVYSMLYLYFRYIYQLVYPIEQSPEYSYDCITAVRHLEDPRNLLSCLTGLIIFGLFIKSLFDISYSVSMKDELSQHEREDHDRRQEDNDVYNNKTDNISNAEQMASSHPEENHKSEKKIVVLDSSLFEMLLWLVIPFIPLTGIVFKLGTLLAERLLYLCSIGYCMLLAYIIHIPIKAMKKQQAKSMSRILYMTVIFGIIAWYTLKTREYNKVWLDDNSLFLHAVKVCPNSAKSNLQVSKLYSNKGDFEKAWFHLNNAKQIDPEFCDTQLQEVFIILGQLKASEGESMLMVEKKLNKAIELAVQNLKCVYTSRQAMDLLSQVWDWQILSARQRNDVKVFIKTIRKQAKLAMNNGLEPLAAKKYTEVASAALEAGMNKKAIKLINLAEKAMEKAWNDKVGLMNVEVDDALSVLRCRLYTLSGTMRSTFLEKHLSKTKENKLEKVSRQISKSTILSKLVIASDSFCLNLNLKVYNNELGKQTREYLQLSSLHALRWIKEDVNMSNIPLLEASAKELTILVALLASQSSTTSADKTISKAKIDVSSEYAKQATHLWLQLQGYHYNRKQFTTSAKFGALYLTLSIGKKTSFLRILKCLSLMYETSDGGGDSASNNINNNSSIAAVKAIQAHFKVWESQALTFTKKKLITSSTCSSLYWYADALAGMPSFFENPENVRFVINLLTVYRRCSEELSDIDANILSEDVTDSLIKKFQGIDCKMRGTCSQ